MHDLRDSESIEKTDAVIRRAEVALFGHLEPVRLARYELTISWNQSDEKDNER